MDVRTAIETGDAAMLQHLLAMDPACANTPVRWGERCELTSHPLHFICDKVFDGTLSRELAGPLASALITGGADVNFEDGDPLNAAASLGATEVALLLLDAGARTGGCGLFGETALHWAATIGDDVLVQRLLEKGAPVDVRDKKWNRTPLAWALHGWSQPPPPGNRGNHREAVKMLVSSGATVDPEWVREANEQGRVDVVAALTTR